MYICISFNMKRYKDIEESLAVYSDSTNKNRKMFLLADINLLDLYLQFIDRSTIDRVLLYDNQELGNWDNFKQFSNLCKKYDLKYSIILKDQ